jgi:hypothetical protein
MREERRVITVLSADLVGSTGLGARLDPEEVKLIVGDVMARVVRVIEGLGGTVKDLAGDGVLALFGAPQAHEDDAERAVRAGPADRGASGCLRARRRPGMGCGGAHRPRGDPYRSGRARSCGNRRASRVRRVWGYCGFRVTRIPSTISVYSSNQRAKRIWAGSPTHRSTS